MPECPSGKFFHFSLRCLITPDEVGLSASSWTKPPQKEVSVKKLDGCHKKFSLAKDNISKANACLDILEICCDFRDALNFLDTVPPEPCKNLSVAIDDEHTSVLLTWSATGERGIKYSLVRRKGTRPPANEKDGDILLKKSDSLSYTDKSLESGINYSYSVFADRKNLCSPPVSTSSVVVRTVISDVTSYVKENKIDVIKELRKTTVDFIKSQHDEILPCSPVDDFVMHTILKEGNMAEMSKRYMILLYQFASVVAKAKGKISEDGSKWLLQLATRI